MRPPHTAKRDFLLADLSERDLIARLNARVGTAPDTVILGIGDDAAVLAPERGAVNVVTTDCLVEHVHFRRDWTAFDAIGHKALNVNLSDLAAMGATPRASLLSLVLPGDLALADFDGLIEGFAAVSKSAGAPLVGGNLARSPGPVVIDVTAIGSVRARRVLRRNTARAGDELYVTGALGSAAAGLAMLAAGADRRDLDEAALECVARYERPVARVRCGSIVSRTGSARAAMDVSDGLAATVCEIADQSGVGVVVEAELLPISAGVRAWCDRQATDPVAFAVAGGEDYELAFAVAPRLRSRFLAGVARERNLAITRIGRFVPERGCWLLRNGRPERLTGGFSHFAAKTVT